MSEFDDLTPANIQYIASKVHEGEADPEDARRLLALFCALVRDNRTIPDPLLQHLRQALETYLVETKPLDRALGVRRRVGKPRANEDDRTSLAAEVLRARLKGATHQDAVATVSERFGWGATVIGDAWRDHKRDALVQLRLEHKLFGDEVAEPDRIAEIFKDEPR